MDCPRPMASPARRLRELSPVQDSTRSPMPESPANVRGLAPIARPSRAISTRPRVISAARALSPIPSPSEMPAPRAMTFFSAPASSTPTRSGLV